MCIRDSDENVKYVRAQFDKAIKQLEELTGKKFDEEKFNKACANANRTEMCIRDSGSTGTGLCTGTGTRSRSSTGTGTGSRTGTGSGRSTGCRRYYR